LRPVGAGGADLRLQEAARIARASAISPGRAPRPKRVAAIAAIRSPADEDEGGLKWFVSLARCVCFAHSTRWTRCFDV
jgi:hypothetical protein